MQKCKAQSGGYAKHLCPAMGRVVESQPRSNAKGLFMATIVSMTTGESKGTRVILKQGEHLKNGVVLNYCPFCGNALRDLSDETPIDTEEHF